MNPQEFDPRQVAHLLNELAHILMLSEFRSFKDALEAQVLAAETLRLSRDLRRSVRFATIPAPSLN